MTRAFVSFVSFVLVSSPLAAHAQLIEDIGIRAQGMAGAFVAVVDDATATWWNPAGLATGAFFSGVGGIGYSFDIGARNDEFTRRPETPISHSALVYQGSISS